MTKYKVPYYTVKFAYKKEDEPALIRECEEFTDQPSWEKRIVELLEEGIDFKATKTFKYAKKEK